MKKILPYVFIIVFGLIMYVLTIKGIHGNPTPQEIKDTVAASAPFELSPERGRYALVVSLAEDRSFALSEILGKAAEPDVGYYLGKAYIYFAPGISVLALPLYFLGKMYNIAQVGAYFTIAIFALLNQLIIYKISRQVFKLPIWVSVFIAILFGFGSTSWSYAVTLYQHHVTTFLIISGFYAAWKYKQREKFYFLYAAYLWFAYSYAIFVDYPNLILLLPVMFYFFLNAFNVVKKANGLRISFNLPFVLTSIVFVLMTVLHGYYNQVNFGHWSRLSGSLTGYKEIVAMEKAVLENDTETIKALNSDKNLGNFFSEYSLPTGFTILTVAVDKGIFVFSPVYLIALAGIVTAWAKLSLEKVILLSISAVNLFLYSSWGDPWGGWAFGPRYLIPSMAVLAIFVGYFLTYFKYQALGKILTFILLFYSTAVALVGVLTTNQVPPKVEADYLGMKYNFLLNYDQFLANNSSSYIYNTYLSDFLTLQHYFILIFSCLVIVYLFLLFILPKQYQNGD